MSSIKSRNCSLNSCKAGYIADDIWTVIGLIEGHTRSLPYRSHVEGQRCGPEAWLGYETSPQYGLRV